MLRSLVTYYYSRRRCVMCDRVQPHRELIASPKAVLIGSLVSCGLFFFWNLLVPCSRPVCMVCGHVDRPFTWWENLGYPKVQHVPQGFKKPGTKKWRRRRG